MADFRTIDYEDALQRVLEAVRPNAVETVAPADSLGRALAEDIYADVDLPGFDNSAMDGYALRSADTLGASPDRPIRLRIAGRTSAGSRSAPALEAGEAISIGTGAPLPTGADAIIRLEEIVQNGRAISLRSPVASGRDVRRTGEDVRRGSLVLCSGQEIRAAEIGLLAALGRSLVPVFARTRVAVLTSGDELVEPGAPTRSGQIYNASAPALAAQVSEAGGVPTLLDPVPDDPAKLAYQIELGLRFDVLVIAAGVSTGARDFVRPALARFGPIESWRLNMRPVRPLAFGRIGQTLVFGLPGNPVATILAFELLARPALRALAGHARFSRPTMQATLSEPLESPGGLLSFVRGWLSFEPEATVRSAGGQGTANLATLARANCLIVVPPDIERLDARAAVRVRLLSGNA